MPNDSPFRVLFVCMGNICRSPAGENIFRAVVTAAGLDERIACDSAGTIDYHTGKSPDERMRRVLEHRGIPVTGKARQVRPADLDQFDLILAMDEDNRADLLSLATSDTHRERVRPFVEFCENHEATEVPDPYYGGEAGFELVADLIEDGSQGLLQHILTRLS